MKKASNNLVSNPVRHFLSIEKDLDKFGLLPQTAQSKMWSFMALEAEDRKFKCSLTRVDKCRVVIPMYEVSASREQVNLYTTLEHNE